MKRNALNGTPEAILPNDAASAEEDPWQRETRLSRGKALRKECQRSRHGEAILGQGDRDPMALIEESNVGRLEKLLPIRFTRMAESAFSFFRGTAILQAHDLQGTPSTGIVVQCCGDCHLMNFGGFATPERVQIFDINDFDETYPGPFEWDVKRLATSFELAARWLEFTRSEAEPVVREVLEYYRTAMAEFAQMSVLDTWYARIPLNELVAHAHNSKYQKRLKKAIEKAAENTSEHVYHKITTTVHGKPRIVDSPPLLFHPDPTEFDTERDVAPFLENYRASLPRERQFLFDRYRLMDSACKVVGVGSVGTRCYIALFEGNQGDHLILQVKEARRSVFEGRAGSIGFANNGERVVTGQRLMQSASDIFLGWSHGPHGDCYVRQMRDMKIAPNLAGSTPAMLSGYAEMCGRALARAHAKSGDAALISGYLGNGAAFDEAVLAYAEGYADQVEMDYKLFKKAIRSGRFPIESFPSEIEQAIR
ncbi:MAG TPA: DUF2252 domain-containing protein [Urbifossiella sp.]|nr:DUF2252 domain-containing protein [Urbifossiella sp.]